MEGWQSSKGSLVHGTSLAPQAHTSGHLLAPFCPPGFYVRIDKRWFYSTSLGWEHCHTLQGCCLPVTLVLYSVPCGHGWLTSHGSTTDPLLWPHISFCYPHGNGSAPGDTDSMLNGGCYSPAFGAAVTQLVLEARTGPGIAVICSSFSGFLEQSKKHPQIRLGVSSP